MLVNSDALRQLRAAIQLDVGAPRVAGAFEQLGVKVHVARALGRRDLEGVYSELNAVSNRLADLRTIALKLDWMLGQRASGELDSVLWAMFASSDVNAFLTNVRSLFDHLARAMRAVAPQPGGIPRFSFEDLRKWSLRDDLDHGAQLGARLHQLIVGCEWFEELRALRDQLIHHDALTIVAPEEPGIVMQVYRRAQKLIDEPALLASPNAARFERLAAATMAQLHVLLDQSAVAISDLVGAGQYEGSAQSIHYGLAVVAEWTDDYLAALPP